MSFAAWVRERARPLSASAASRRTLATGPGGVRAVEGDLQLVVQQRERGGALVEGLFLDQPEPRKELGGGVGHECSSGGTVRP